MFCVALSLELYIYNIDDLLCWTEVFGATHRIFAGGIFPCNFSLDKLKIYLKIK